MKKWILSLIELLVCLALFSASGAGEPLLNPAIGNDQPLGIKRLNNFSLLDPERLSMSQSYSFMFLSDGKKSQTSGFYLNQLIYQFSAPISLKLEMGYLHSPFSGGNQLAAPAGELFPGVELLYQPSRNLSFRFQYRAVPSLTNYRRHPHFGWIGR